MAGRRRDVASSWRWSCWLRRRRRGGVVVDRRSSWLVVVVGRCRRCVVWSRGVVVRLVTRGVGRSRWSASRVVVVACVASVAQSLVAHHGCRTSWLVGGVSREWCVVVALVVVGRSG
ncbi:hypothetical protein ACXZ9C_11060 [Streptococcus agalactiae]